MELSKEGFYCWCPPKAKYQETDIFGVYDTICVKDSDLRFIQWTTSPNMQARKRKIEKFFKEKDVFIGSEVWGWDGKKRNFKKIYL